MFNTLEHMVGETFVILYVHPLIFLRFVLSLLKFSLIFMNMQMSYIIYDHWMKDLIQVNHRGYKNWQQWRFDDDFVLKYVHLSFFMILLLFFVGFH